MLPAGIAVSLEVVSVRLALRIGVAGQLIVSVVGEPALKVKATVMNVGTAEPFCRNPDLLGSNWLPVKAVVLTGACKPTELPVLRSRVLKVLATVTGCPRRLYGKPRSTL